MRHYRQDLQMWFPLKNVDCILEDRAPLIEEDQTCGTSTPQFTSLFNSANYEPAKLEGGYMRSFDSDVIWDL